jgi:hypothetical protein
VESECNGLFLTLWDAEVDACNDSVANEGFSEERTAPEVKWNGNGVH